MGHFCAIVQRILLCGMLCLPLLGTAQQSLTKSGTPVSAVPRQRALFPSAKAASPDPTAGTFLVLSPSGWRPALEPLLQWKREQGFRVEWMAADTRQRDTLRARLAARWRQGSPLRPPQRYVLLVGDVDRIQAFVGRHTPEGLSSSVTDLYYGEYTGDYLPEALVGRLSVSDSLELARVVAKLVAYGQGLLSPSSDRLLLVAGREDQPPAPTTTNGQVDYLRRHALARRPALSPVTFPNSDTSTAAGLLALMHAPYALVNYTGHGLSNGWSGPVFTAAMADTLAGFAPAVMVNNCCLTNAFSATCFGELMLRNSQSLVGVIGATNETLWNEDFYWAVGAKYPPVATPSDDGLPGAFDTLLSSPAAPYAAEPLTLGRMLYNGCRAVTLAGSVFDAFYWETYCLLGDPSTVPALGLQDSLWLTFGTPVEAGATSLAVTTLPYTRVSVTTGTALLGTAVADSMGHVTVPLVAALPPDSVRITAVRPQGRPCRRIVAPAVPDAPRLAVTGYRADSASLRLTVANVGRQPASGAILVLAIEGLADTLRLPLGIPAAGTLDTLFPLRDGWRGRTVEGTLTACADTSCTLLTIAFEAPADCPRLGTVALLTADSLPATLLLPDREYLLAVTLAQPADSLVAEINGHRGVAVGQRQSLFPFTLDTAFRAEVHLALFSSCGQEEDHFWLQGFRAVETFEDGTLGSYPWQLSAAYPWQPDTLAREGRHALRSCPSLPHGMKSILSIEVDVLEADSVTFFYNVSSEASDWLNFYVDGRRQGFWSGASGWRRYAWPLAKGPHRLEWHYAKDGSVSERDDCARLDQIAFPLCRWDAPYGNPASGSHDTTGIRPFPMLNSQLSIFPNPVSDLLTVRYPGSAQVEVVDVVGRCVGRFAVGGTTRWSTRHLPAGVYWLVVRADGTLPCITKLIVTK